MHARVNRRSFFQVATVGALIVAALAAFWYIRADRRSEVSRQRVEAAQRLSLELQARLEKGLAAEEGVYALAKGLPSFGRGQFVSFGRALIERFGFSYVAWAPAVDAGAYRAWERRHGLRIAGSGAAAADMFVPVLYAAEARASRPSQIRSASTSCAPRAFARRSSTRRRR